MDRSGAMPRQAWVEIRDADGKILVSIPAQISGGSVTATLPAFPAGTRGTVELFTDEDSPEHREVPEVKDLPTTELLMVVQMG